MASTLRREFIRVGKYAASKVGTGASLLPPDHQSNIAEAAIRALSPLLLRMGREVDRSAKGSTWNIERKDLSQELMERIARTYLATRAPWVSQVTTITTAKIIRRVVANATDQGMPNAELAKALRNTFTQMARPRAELISRTESHTAAMTASQEAVKEVAPEATKVWTTANDGRVRAFGRGDEWSHRQVDGQRRPMSEPFEVPGRDGVELLRYPGDPHGSAGNIIHCRCVMTYET